MKKILLTIVLLLFSFPAFAVFDCQSGSWFDEERSGEGANVEVLNDTVLAYFYSHSAFGQEWFVLQGPRPVGDTVLFTVHDVVKLSEDPWEIISQEVGVASIEFIGEDALIFSFNYSLDLNRLGEEDIVTPWCLHEQCSGEFLYTRLTRPIPCF